MRYPHHNDEGVPVGFYELNTFPGSNQIVVSNHSTILPEFRKQGHGLRMAQVRLARAQMQGFDYMLCTVRADNAAQLRLMQKVGGWKNLDTFLSRESGVYIAIFGRGLA